jgi:hypothetical protein
VVSGPNSMSVKYNAGWAGLSLQHADFNTSGYTHLRFAINMAGQPLSGLSVGLYDMSSVVIKQINPQSYASAASGGWHIVSIPLVDLGGANTTITRVQMQESTGGARPTFYIDDMGFTGSGSTPPPEATPTPEPPPPPPPMASSGTFIYDDSLRWSNWSWQTGVNPNVTSPVHAGSKSMSVTYNAAWAGLSFHNSGFNT